MTDHTRRVYERESSVRERQRIDIIKTYRTTSELLTPVYTDSQLHAVRWFQVFCCCTCLLRMSITRTIICVYIWMCNCIVYCVSVWFDGVAVYRVIDLFCTAFVWWRRQYVWILAILCLLYEWMREYGIVCRFFFVCMVWYILLFVVFLLINKGSMQ